jgi:hypothetical protein
MNDCAPQRMHVWFGTCFGCCCCGCGCCCFVTQEYSLAWALCVNWDGADSIRPDQIPRRSGERKKEPRPIRGGTERGSGRFRVQTHATSARLKSSALPKVPHSSSPSSAARPLPVPLRVRSRRWLLLFFGVGAFRADARFSARLRSIAQKKFDRIKFWNPTICTASSAGGRGGIRTHGTLAGTPVFKTGALNHSATLPSY